VFLLWGFAVDMLRTLELFTLELQLSGRDEIHSSLSSAFVHHVATVPSDAKEATNTADLSTEDSIHHALPTSGAIVPVVTAWWQDRRCFSLSSCLLRPTVLYRTLSMIGRLVHPSDLECAPYIL